MQKFFPLYDRFPRLRDIPRVELCSLPSPVQSLAHILPNLWIKRDDMNASLCGGNKVRALEFLLGGLHSGDSVITVGGTGSTHILATAVHAARIGVSTYALRWRHEMNPVATQVSSRIEALIDRPTVHLTPVLPIARARLRAVRRKARYIPVGGSVPLGVLGHVNAALELVQQIETGAMPQPSRVILPMGTGGTAAGLLLGFAFLRMGPLSARLFCRFLHSLRGATRPEYPHQQESPPGLTRHVHGHGTTSGTAT